MAKTRENTVAAVFTEAMREDRLRKKNEALAAQLLGKNRRSSAPGPGARKVAGVASLESRVSINGKRSVSTTLNPTMFKHSSAKAVPKYNLPTRGNVDQDWTHDLHDAVDREPRRVLPRSSIIDVDADAARHGTSKPRADTGISIRGLAGPYTIMAENFAPGTTAADIESAMTPYGGAVIDCIIIKSRPVTAEVTFEHREGAEIVIAQFHGKTADGLILSIRPKGLDFAGRAPEARSDQRDNVSKSIRSTAERAPVPAAVEKPSKPIQAELPDVDERSQHSAMDVDDQGSRQSERDPNGLYSDRMPDERNGRQYGRSASDRRDVARNESDRRPADDGRRDHNRDRYESDRYRSGPSSNYERRDSYQRGGHSSNGYARGGIREDRARSRYA